MEYFDFVKKVNYEGEQSSNPFAFKFYDPDRVIFGKKMSEHLPFAMAWWHNLGAAGADMFGVGTADKSFGAIPGTMEHARAKVDAGFEFMEKLGIKYFCFHDVDLVPEDKDINVTNARLDEISDYILEKMNGTDIKCLWGTAPKGVCPPALRGHPPEAKTAGCILGADGRTIQGSFRPERMCQVRAVRPEPLCRD